MIRSAAVRNRRLLSVAALMTAIVLPATAGGSQLDAVHQNDRGPSIVKAFRESGKRHAKRAGFARPAKSFKKNQSRPKPKRPDGIARARHYIRLFDTLALRMRVSSQQGRPLQLPRNFLQGVKPEKYLIALLYLSIRNANAGLAEDSQNAEGYMLLGLAYDRLRAFEMAHIGRPRVAGDFQKLEQNMRAATVRISQRELLKTRLRQATSAYRQCLVIDPDNIRVTRALSVIYEQQRFLDTSIEMLERSIAIAKARPLTDNMSKPEREHEDRLRSLDTSRLKNLKKQVRPTLDKIEAMLPRLGVDRAGRMLRLKAVSLAMVGGCWSKALQLVEGDFQLFAGNPNDMIPYVETLLSLGRIEVAVKRYRLLCNVNDALLRNENWRQVGASIELCRSEYPSAKPTFLRSARAMEVRGFEDLTHSIPFVVGSPQRLPVAISNARSRTTADPRLSPWAKIHSLLVHQAMHISPNQTADQLLKAAICDLELGDTKSAAETLQRILDTSPDAAIRPLTRFYLQLITGKSIARTPPLVGSSGTSDPTKDAVRKATFGLPGKKRPSKTKP